MNLDSKSNNILKLEQEDTVLFFDPIKFLVKGKEIDTKEAIMTSCDNGSFKYNAYKDGTYLQSDDDNEITEKNTLALTSSFTNKYVKADSFSYVELTTYDKNGESRTIKDCTNDPRLQEIYETYNNQILNLVATHKKPLFTENKGSVK